MLAARDVPERLRHQSPTRSSCPVHDDIALALYDTSGTLVAGAGPPTADDVTRQALGDRVTDTESRRGA